jgi:glycosyltransferase involved in cell wall biosynthesis
VPKHFIEEMLNPEIEKIIVPSQHTRDAIVNTLNTQCAVDLCMPGSLKVLQKIEVIPHGVDHALFKPLHTKHDKFTFLINKGFRNLQDRGGTQYALKSYIDEFTNKDDVKLILKINTAYGVPDILNIIKEMGGDRTDLPEIAIDTNNYEYKNLNGLYNEADVFVATTRAEGFNLPCIEAMSCGLPVITTNFGGQTDFVNEDNGFLIGYDLEEIKHEVQYEGCSWATPKIDEIRRVMRECYNHPDYVRAKGEIALETSQNYSWEKTANEFIKLSN